MKICFIADAGSPITRNWIDYFIQRGHQVHIISTYSSPRNGFGKASLSEFPIFFSRSLKPVHPSVASTQNGGSRVSRMLSEARVGRLSQVGIVLSDWLAPVTVSRHIGRVRQLINEIKPDLTHALRIPVEGILAALATGEFPLLISVWGNDFTLHDNHPSPTRVLTTRALRRADGLLSDCARDLRLARARGFDKTKPTSVLPGAGGVQLDVFYPAPDPRSTEAVRAEFDIPAGATVVINPRGLRGYVRNDVFFKAIPLVLQQYPQAIFLCSGMQGSSLANSWISKERVDHAVRLLPVVSRHKMAELFRAASVMVSPSLHDGTPNTLLEGMASGCFPVAGDIESVREWITDDWNGLLCDSTSPPSLADAIVRAISDADLRRQAAQINRCLIAERADYVKVMARAAQFYSEVIEAAHSNHKRTRVPSA
jgi:glycosyltransferase involved in cell wall biosynthesis